jgi:hypothetical protein|tara:strand:- start:6591 stop:6923 length:333 start_codon:yes stop_codon:yes gene_type:complete
MSGYASGKYAYGLCDVCGQRFFYQDLKKNWKGFKVCPEDYEPKEPQLEPLRFNSDAIALHEPRPDREEPLEVFIGGTGDTTFESDGMQPKSDAKTIELSGSVGTVTVTIT